jgi:ribosomal protein S18 acetylase RimI-like enzyme
VVVSSPGRLLAFTEPDGDVVLGWVRSAEELDAWASRGDFPLQRSIFAEWHSDLDVRAYVLVHAGEPRAYGEIWEDAAQGEVELARIIVAPESRGRGVGREFTRLLSDQARRRGFDEIWLRVVPTNAAALACYRSAGFKRASRAEEDAFNRGQPRTYVWMRLLE